jgi:hypothetical protein
MTLTRRKEIYGISRQDQGTTPEELQALESKFREMRKAKGESEEKFRCS